MRRPLREIPLKAVDLRNLTLVITYAPDLGPLKDSIARVGMLCPPILQKIPGADRYRVVSGYKRLKALEALGFETISARLAPSEDDLSLFLLGLHENLGTRPLNVVEKSLVLDKLVHQFRLTKEKILGNHLPALGLGSDPKTLDLYLSLSGLEEQIKRGLVNGLISIPTAHQLSTFSRPDRLAFCRFATALALGKNLQREFLSLLADLSRIQKTPINLLLEDEEVKTLAEDPKVQTPIRAQRIRKLLIRRRYPRFSRATNGFEELKKSLKLPSHFSVTASPFFEGGDLRLTVTFRSREQLTSSLDALKAMAENPALVELLEFSAQNRE